MVCGPSADVGPYAVHDLYKLLKPYVWTAVLICDRTDKSFAMSLNVRSARRVLNSSRGRATVALLSLGALLTLRLSHEARTQAEFPHHSPAALAHFLADFTNHPRLYTHITGTWKVEEESNDNTCWRYVVSYECGARCDGRAHVASCDTATQLTHGASDQHRVQLTDRRCWNLPALPWPRLCESMETDSIITARTGGGARLEEQAYVQCGVLATVAGHCDVRAARLSHHRSLLELLELNDNII